MVEKEFVTGGSLRVRKAGDKTLLIKDESGSAAGAGQVYVELDDVLDLCEALKLARYELVRERLRQSTKKG